MGISFIMLKPDAINNSTILNDINDISKSLKIHKIYKKKVIITNKIIEVFWNDRYSFKLSRKLMEYYLLEKKVIVIFVFGCDILNKINKLKKIIRKMHSSGLYSNCLHTPGSLEENSIQLRFLLKNQKLSTFTKTYDSLSIKEDVTINEELWLHLLYENHSVKNNNISESNYFVRVFDDIFHSFDNFVNIFNVAFGKDKFSQNLSFTYNMNFNTYYDFGFKTYAEAERISKMLKTNGFCCILIDKNKNRGNLVAIMGPSGSGKTTIQNQLSNYGYSKPLMYTTRNRRNDESESDYRFVDKQKYFKLLYENEIVVSTEINGVYYGISKNILNNEMVIVVDKSLYEQLKIFNVSMKTFYLEVSEKECYKRMKKRGDSYINIIEKLYLDKLMRCEEKNLGDFFIHQKDLNESLRLIKHFLK